MKLKLILLAFFTFLQSATLGNIPSFLPSLQRTCGAAHPGLETAAFTVNDTTRFITIGRNARKLVSSLADGNVTALYGYESGAPFVNAVTVKVDGVTAMTRTVSWDAVNDRITNITCTVGGSNVASFAYTWQTNANRITSVTQADGSYWVYDYDTRGHLTSGERFHADGTPYFGLQYGAAFDSIGNTLEGGPLAGGVPEHSFTPNDLNVHVSRAWSNKVELLGRAATNTTVTVNAAPTDRAGEWFRAIITVDNAASAVETNVTITAVWFDAVASNDVVASTTGSVLVAKAGEVPDYDNRASMTGSSRFENTFDAFGLLVEVVNTAVIPNVRETYTYFADGRRSTKKTYRGSTGDWTNTFSHAFIYDDWSLIHERITDELLAATTTREYVWGLDLVGQRNGEIGPEAGGIGGLLAIRQIEGGVTNVYLPIADHIGNVMHLVDADSGEVVANYLYSPYGVLAGAWGEAKDACPFRFQSKYMDAETGLYYFGYRFYEPASVKWLTRDPKGEEGGYNLTAAFDCDPINKYDGLGLAPGNTWDPRSYATVHKQLWDDFASGAALDQANAAIWSYGKILAGVGQAIIGGKATVGSGGLLAFGGYAMVVSGSSRITGGLTDYANIFTGGSLGNGDVVETGFVAMFGERHGPTVRNINDAVLTAGVSTLLVVQREAAIAAETAALQKQIAAERTAANVPPVVQGQRFVDSAVREYLPDLKLSVPPRYDPLLRTPGESLSYRGCPIYSKVGPQSLKGGFPETVDTILHEEIHLRWSGKTHSELGLLLQRYWEMRGW